MSAQKHYLDDSLFQNQVVIHVIGCGGTGSHLVPRLPLLHKSMLALGHPAGIKVVVWDGDNVSESNTVRQNFFPPDIGKNKASIMVNRINSAYGLDWEARPCRFSAALAEESYLNADIIIGCVDTKSARREIDQYVRSSRLCAVQPGCLPTACSLSFPPLPGPPDERSLRFLSLYRFHRSKALCPRKHQA